MKDDPKKENKPKSRRQMLKSMVAGSAAVGGGKVLSDTWSKPLTDVIILPSHGRTSGDLSYGDTGGTGTASGDGYRPGGPNSEYAGEYFDGDYTDRTREYVESYFGEYYSSPTGDSDGQDGDYTYGDYSGSSPTDQ